jgi:hypothetical protein
MIGLSSSALDVNYQLYIGGSTFVGGPVAGSGTGISFGSQMTAGAYTVVATDAITGCTNTMAGAANINVNPAPAAYSVIGGGGYCAGSTGVSVGVNGSAGGINYELFNGLTPVITLPGAGTPINFGMQTSAGTYSVIATNTTTGCSAVMPGTATVVINPLPTVYSVIGGGSYCAGAAGVHVGLSNASSGIDYTLKNGTTTVSTIGGSGGPLDFGLQTVAGTYTVYAANTLTGCSANMSGSATVSVNPLSVPSVNISLTGNNDTINGA